jgi:hypothetical protein
LPSIAVATPNTMPDGTSRPSAGRQTNSRMSPFSSFDSIE